jgi:hypothetical protein
MASEYAFGTSTYLQAFFLNTFNRIDGVMVHLECVDRGYESSGWVKPKTIKLVFLLLHKARNIKMKEQRLVGVSEWSSMSICGLLFQ